ncbi:MAG: Phosphatidylserine decarboxylase proenzyme [Opitutia bacterium UBA7350]|nr:MAG: Phosphatidylserine decarboxylase proenzyme [Opitutae bacterium UBA7350]
MKTICIKDLSLIALGSSLGGVLRIVIVLVAVGLGLYLPLATILINVSGSYLVGRIAGLKIQQSGQSASSVSWHFWVTGFCGGYTTFSLFSKELLDLLLRGSGLVAGLYGAGSVVLSLLAVWLGFSLARRRAQGREGVLNARIEYFDRAKGVLQWEPIYGEGFMRWAYGTAIGRLTVWLFVQRAWFSVWYGWRMNQTKSRAKIGPFIRHFRLDRKEFIEPKGGFRHFNEFFYRRLQAGARPIEGGLETVVFPADGRHLVIPNVDAASVFYIKGQAFDLVHFVGDAEVAKRFAGGALLISRLCPIDYHRFHFPLAGEVNASVSLKGSLRSVSPLALRRKLSILWENRRTRTHLHAPKFGEVLIFEVGATCVGGIHQTYKPGTVAQGGEKGYFSFGGSCVVTLFKPGTVKFDTDLLDQAIQGTEVYARMGESCGKTTGKKLFTDTP